ncbi:MAG TPA: SipW-dependent-type signal peptide-containing protein [Acidimicrobiales bacterium]|nr:SipW-dependent-type signal peptide-containing protein [Acidimicrobiales bacterium]
MKLRIPLVAGAAGAAALALVVVGPGAFASFTSSVSANQSIKTGTFQLEATAGQPTVAGPLIGDANTIGQPILNSSTGAEPAVPDGNNVSFQLWNVNPGDSYTEPLTIYDVGSLQGQVNTVTYTPDTSTSAMTLEKYMTVEVQVNVNGVWTDVHTSSADGSAGLPLPANSSHTYYLDYSFGPQFLQPNPNMYDTAEASAAGFSTNELSTSFRIVFTFTNKTVNPNSQGGYVQNQNDAEGLSASPSVTFNGTNTP